MEVLDGESNSIIIKIDGIDGSGKTSLINELKNKLSTKYNVITTSEFNSLYDQRYDKRSSHTISNNLYHWALEPEFGFNLIQRQLAFLLASLRFNQIVIPELVKYSEIIICDRSPLACYAYSDSLGKEYVDLLDKYIAPFIGTSITFILDIDANKSWKRRSSTIVKNEIIDLDTVEKLGLSHQENVRRNYLKFANIFPNINILDANKPTTTLVEIIISMLKKAKKINNV